MNSHLPKASPTASKPKSARGSTARPPAASREKATAARPARPAPRTFSPCIGLLGPYSSAHLGDIADRKAMLDALHEKVGSVRFLAITTLPDEMTLNHHIPAIDITGDTTACGPGWLPGALRRLMGTWQATAGLDALVVTGSGHSDDYWGGPWRQPYRLLAWSICAHLRGVPVAVFCIGVDEMPNRLGAWLCVQAMKIARFRAFRDMGSLDQLRGLGLDAPSRVCPDPCFGFTLPSMHAPNPAYQYVVLSPFSCNDGKVREDADYRRYLLHMAKLAEHLLHSGIGVRFACGPNGSDAPVVNRILSLMESRAAECCVRDYIKIVEDYLILAASSRLVVASQLHAVSLAMVAGAPVLAVSSARKVHQVMEDLDLVPYIVDLGEAGGAEIITVANLALEQGNEIRELIASKRPRRQAELASAYNNMLAALNFRNSGAPR